jgi:OmpA-OmpF porin, OOP family
MIRAGKTVAVLFIIFIGHSLKGQNLVPNPGFEFFYRAPFSFNDSPEKFKLPGWSSASTGTPDHFHALSSGDASVPKNWAGISNAHSGNGYVGIFVGGKRGKRENGRTYREYIQCKLLDSLLQDSLYQLEFFFKLSSYSHYTVNRIGLLLLDSSLRVKNNNVLRLDPTLSIIRSSLEAGNWENAKMIYKAHGGESYLIIGNFYDDQKTENERLDFRTGNSHTLSGTAYFYIDDVSVTQVEKAVDTTVQIFSDAMTVKANSAYVLRNIQFEFDSFQLAPLSYPELDNVVAALEKNPDWRIEIKGHADDQGSNEYNLQLSVNRAKGVADYLIAKGIGPNKIVVKGFGNQVPLSPGKDELSRAINRRVEVEFID